MYWDNTGLAIFVFNPLASVTSVCVGVCVLSGGFHFLTDRSTERQERQREEGWSTERDGLGPHCSADRAAHKWTVDTVCVTGHMQHHCELRAVWGQNDVIILTFESISSGTQEHVDYLYWFPCVNLIYWGGDLIWFAVTLVFNSCWSLSFCGLFKVFVFSKSAFPAFCMLVDLLRF